MANFTEQEIDERVEILKKLKSLLESERNKFREYLKVLETQEISIQNEDTVSIAAHTKLEEEVVKNISNIQKVIVPMTELYKSAKTENPLENDENILKIQNDLTELQKKVSIQNQKNQNLLRTILPKVKVQIENFRNPYKNLKNVYGQTGATGSLVEVNA